MPGIFGLGYRQPSDRVRVVADRMRIAMSHYPWYTSRIYVDPAERIACGMVALGNVVEALSQAPDAHRPIVMLDGEIYDYPERRRELESEGEIFTTDDHAELVARGYRKWGHAVLDRIEGSFNLAMWEPTDQTLLLANDRFGLKPLYCAIVEDGLAFASEIKALLKDPRVPRQQSLKGVAQFFTFGHFLGDDTLFEGIRAVEAASALTYDARSGVVRTWRYWELKQGPLISDKREALSRLDATFLKAVARRVRGPLKLGLSLSGGMDARTILAAIRPGTARVKSMSIGIPGSIDHRAAVELARLAGAEHHCEYLESDFLLQFGLHLRKLVFLTDGHYLDQAITVPTLPVYRSLGIQALLRGHAGELLHMDKAYAFSVRPEDLNFADVAAVERWLWSHLTSYMIDDIDHEVFRPEIRAPVEALARQSLGAALRRSEGFTPDAQRLWHLFIRERLHRETAMSMQMFNTVVDIRLPYLDTDFIDVAMTVPPALKMGDEIQSFILGRRFPAFLQVVNANTGTTPRSGNLQKTVGTLRLRTFSKLGVPGYQPYERLGLWLSHQLQPFVMELLLSDRTLDRGLFDRETLRRVIADHRDRRKNHTFLIMAMLIFETGQRQFVDEDPTARPASL